MSSGPKNVTSTTNTAPPDYMVPALKDVTNQAGTANLDLTRRNIGNQGQTAAGLEAMFNRGAQGSPQLSQAMQTNMDTMQGNFINSNPYLDQTFNRAADLTRGRLSSEFAGAGRNQGASMPARSEELQTLASNIFGGNYQSERDRMGQAVSQSIPLANTDWQNIQGMVDAGNFPIDQYIKRISALIPGAGGETSATQPIYKTGIF